MNMWKLFGPLLSPEDVGGFGGSDTVSELAQDLADMGDASDGDDTSGGDDDSGGDDEGGREEGDRDTSRRIPGKNDDEEAEEEEKESEDETEDEEESEDDDDKDTDEEEDEEGDKKLVKRVEGRPTLKQIKDIYPDIFKRIPYMREMYFADEKFRQVIADPEQAQVFVEKAGHFDRLETTLMQGDPTVLLEELGEGNRDAFQKVATNFLPTLRKIDANLYTELTLPIIKELLYHANEYGKARGDNGKNLVRSAEWLADFVFQNGGKIPDIKTEAGEAKHPAEIELQKLKDQQNKDAYRGATTDVNTRIDKSLEAMVRDGLGAGLNNFAKTAVIDRTLNEFISTLKSDRPFQLKLETLWKAAKNAGFTEAAKAQIADAYVQKGRQILRGIRSKYVTEALGGKRKIQRPEGEEREDKGQKVEKNQDRDTKPRKRNFDSHGSSGRSGTRREAVLDSRKIDYSRTSDEDILSNDPGRIKLKGK